MSAPSDNENSKKRQETFYNRDSSGDDSKDIAPDGKKKRLSKTTPKPAGVLADFEVSPGTSNNSKTGKNETASKGDVLAAEKSGDKNVGEVRDDIEQLKLNEGMPKDLKSKTLETTGPLQTNPDIELPPQSGDPVCGASISNETVQPKLENVLEKEPDASESDVSTHSSSNLDSIQSSSNLEIQGNAPPNSLNESFDTDETSEDKDFDMLSSSNADLKRAAFAQNIQNTLDDVSDLASDVSDLQTDSSSGRPTVFHPAQQGTSQLEEIPECSVSEYKTVKSVLQEESIHSEALSQEKKKLNTSVGLPTKNVDASDYKTARDDSSQSNSGDQKGSDAKGNFGEKCGSSKIEHVDDKKQDVSNKKLDLSKKDDSGEVVPKIVKLIPEIPVDDDSSSNMEIVEEAMGDAPRESKGNEDGEYLRQSGLNQQGDNVDVVNQVNDERLEEQVPRHEIDDSSNNSNEQAESNGSQQVSEQEGSGRQETSDDNSNILDQEAAGDQEDSSAQGNNNGEDFLDGNFVRYPIDSTTSTSDSGIENSDAALMRNDRPNELGQYEVAEAFQDNSEENSSLATSELARLNEYHRWMGAGERGNVPELAPLAEHSNQPAHLREGMPNLGASTDQPAPSTSSANQSDWPPPGVVYLAKQKVLNVPMECAEQFDSEGSNGKEVSQRSTAQDGDRNLKPNLNLESQPTEATGVNLGLRPISPGADSGKDNIMDDVENGNANQGEDSSENGKSQTVQDPKMSQLIRDNSEEQLSSSSMEQDGSLADMDEAVDTSEYSKSDGNMPIPSNLNPQPKVPRSDDRPLIVDTKTTESCPKQKDKKKPSQKRGAKLIDDNKKKKRKGGKESCKYQATLNVNMPMETSSSDEKAEE